MRELSTRHGQVTSQTLKTGAHSLGFRRIICSPKPTITTTISQNAGSEQSIVNFINNIEGVCMEECQEIP